MCIISEVGFTPETSRCPCTMLRSSGSNCVTRPIGRNRFSPTLARSPGDLGIIRANCCAAPCWRIVPSGTEGYRTAEVTLGGVETDELSSTTMQSKRVPGLYFIGEVVDVTGWLGGYNFQWAWASGHAAGVAV